MLYFCSCATIFTGTSDHLYFKSSPDSATVTKNGNVLCKTPCDIKMKRSLNSTEVEIAKPGYESKIISLDKTFNAVSVVNLLSVVGWAIDLATGAVNKYDQKVYNVELSKAKTASTN